jgi:uncharacterized protein YecT (DUF1311 family)
MRLLLLTAVFLSCISSCGAQESAAFRACNKAAKAQYDLDLCASAEAKRVDAEMNRVYRAVLAAAANDKLAMQKVTIAEKAWIAYRDAFVDATYPAEDKQAEYGTMYPMEVDLLIADLTRSHIRDLKALLQGGQ